MKTVMLVFGTRPEAIKMCPLVKEFQKHPDEFKTIVCVTGQHRAMLDQVLNIFDVKPDYDLNIMKQGQDLTDITARVLIGLRDLFKEYRPDVVLVHGDTTTSTAGALAAFYAQIPVGHVEAGLRTHNLYSPWPEEMNRQGIGRIANYDFARVDVYFGKTNANENKIAFDNVMLHKLEIESNLGVNLEWDRGDDVKRSIISYRLENVSIYNENDWLQIAKFHAKWSKKFIDAIVPYLK